MNKKQHFLMDSFLQNKIISKEELEIYQFGIECLILKIVHCLSYIIIGFLMKMPLELLLMGSFLIPLRRSAGGYHAKTRTGCYMFSCAVVVLALSVCRLLSINYVWFFILLLADLLIVLFAPIDNENRTMDLDEKYYFRKKAVIILAIANAVCLLGVLVKNKLLYAPIIMSVFVSAFLILLGKYSNSVRQEAG